MKTMKTMKIEKVQPPMTTSPIKPRILRRPGGRLHTGLKPIVLEYHPRSKRRRDRDEGDDDDERYSDSLEDIQKAEKDLVRVARRATRAVAKGVDTYDEGRRRSARSKEDGAIEDYPHNMAKAMSETLREGADIPMDLADALAPKHYRKRVRRNLRRISGTLRLFRL